ncbi:MAG: TraR/DksA family transcriptional regulator [Gammaproteobacteria bacterium]
MTDFSSQQRQLQALVADLEARQRRLAQHGREGVPADFADQASARENDEVVASLARQVDEELAQARAALARLDAGTYGRCVRCGQGIAPARLAAVPFATMCAGCA